MFRYFFALLVLQIVSQLSVKASDEPIIILVNQVAYNLDAPKTAVIQSERPLPQDLNIVLMDSSSSRPFKGRLFKSEQVTDWNRKSWFTRFDFSSLIKAGYYRIRVVYNGESYESPGFQIGKNALSYIAIPAITNFFYHQRASSPEEQEADQHVRLFGSDKTVDLRGGWCDASGDVSKYFSHLAYTNFMSPQQIPMVDWSPELIR